MIYAFEKLEVWKKARELSKDIYDFTDSFPEEERYGLTNQLRRASISVCSNIAEGSTRQGKPDQARFYQIAFGSLIESLNQLILANDLGFLSTNDLKKLRSEIETIGRMLNALHSATHY